MILESTSEEVFQLIHLHQYEPELTNSQSSKKEKKNVSQREDYA